MDSITHRELERHGRPIDLILKSLDEENEYGETYSDTTESVIARVMQSNAPTPRRSHQEADDYDADSTVFIKNTVSGITDGGGQGATGVDVDLDGSAEYRVLNSFDQDNGLIQLTCERL